MGPLNNRYTATKLTLLFYLQFVFRAILVIVIITKEYNTSNIMGKEKKSCVPKSLCRRNSKSLCDADRRRRGPETRRDVNDTRLRGALRHFLEGPVSGSAFGTFGIHRSIAHLPLMLFSQKRRHFFYPPTKFCLELLFLHCSLKLFLHIK